jgi:cystathionine beta-lyase/cystathionine gamma-synthase
MDFARKAMGLNPSPFDAWLASRGIKTLAVRMEKHQTNAFAVAEFLQNHPLVKTVYYPGLVSHLGYEIAKQQMSGFGGIVSVEFNLDLETMKRLISSFTVFSLAESLGGVESLVDHPASMTHASIPASERAKIGLSDGLVRFSIGIEDTEDLVTDLEIALNKVLLDK